MESASTGERTTPPEKRVKLWTRDFSLITAASALGAAGGIASGFALEFFVFDETGSTLAAALVLAIQLIPFTLVPLVVAPAMDRLPRKTFLVAGDLACGVAFALLGLYLKLFEFSYIGYLLVSLAIAVLEAIDQLAWTSIYPEVIPEGAEQQGNAVSSMLFSTLYVIMAPVAAFLLDTIGVANMMLIQGGLAIAAAAIESLVHVREHEREPREEQGLAAWVADLRETGRYLKEEKGLMGLFGYMAFSNGLATGYSPILIAFFRTTPGFTTAMYAFFSVAEFIGRTIGSAIQYRVKVPKEKRFGLCFMVYAVYDIMDTVLLWLGYPLMLVNRGICGFLGSQSMILRSSGMQRYIPEHMRSRVYAFSDALIMLACSVMALGIGALGELIDYRSCVTVCGVASLVAAFFFVWSRRSEVSKVFEAAE